MYIVLLFFEVFSQRKHFNYTKRNNLARVFGGHKRSPRVFWDNVILTSKPQHFIVSEFNAYDKCYVHVLSRNASVTLSSPGGADSELAFSTSWDAEKEFAAKKMKNKL